MRHSKDRPARAPRTLAWMAAALLVLGGAAACDALDSLLEVEAPNQIPEEVLNDPTKAQLLVNGAISDFDCALGAYIVLGGITGEELIDATQTADRWPYDRREVSPTDGRYATFGCAAIGTYTPLSTARFTADNVLAKLQAWTDAEMPAGTNRTLLIATAAAYSGYAHLLLGEGFCTAAVDGGPELTQAQMFALAEEKFTVAIQAATAVGAAADNIRNLALVGRARAQLDLGDYAGAAADAALVPANFVYNATASATPARRQNRVFEQNGSTDATSVGPLYRNLTFGGVADPRVPVVNRNRNATDGTAVWHQTKYPAFTTPIPIATGDEAVLIRAEALARAGQADAARDLINTLHTKAGIPAYGGGTPEQVLQQIVEERRRELFLEGHHLYDLQRFNITPQPAAGTAYHKGGTYGTTKCWPLPNVERLNNPNIG
ncbi:MAG TPA: RagB/SusD family nutrient uptake outer membrane protein [Longimicrobium sp.]|nr:RagB/SusD family nutrient uptake outer membrane protein [Longimicrobium sp.]